MTLTTTRVLVVDDHAYAREAIREILDMDDHFNVIGIVSNGQEAIGFMEKWLSDLIFHSLDTISQAFIQEGFQVSVRRMLPTGFVDLSHGKKWYNQVEDQLQFAYEQSYLFRFVAPKAGRDRT
ncbi:Response regulator receiver domain-containing protein [Paenibacillus algorifonticola]|uniref:Response regulator receiver domain-containing protein n=1 Tax=Paenibacillus algorifonticola TaxID=684063 RepID=A0A1I2ISV7_9BACL|nr:response regulator [Paenibacillus algorifonticola]SFF45369.1 Response regulator receiver domain-containing protein [Paenibacillus algorifonticola]